jgi:hypothetical protein
VFHLLLPLPGPLLYLDTDCLSRACAPQVDFGNVFTVLNNTLLSCETWARECLAFLQPVVTADGGSLLDINSQELPPTMLSLLSNHAAMRYFNSLSIEQRDAVIALDERARFTPIATPLKAPLADVARYLRWRAKVDRVTLGDAAAGNRVTLTEVDRLASQSHEFCVTDEELGARARAALAQASDACRSWLARANTELETFTFEAPALPVQGAALLSEAFASSTRSWLSRLASLHAEATSLAVTVPATAAKLALLKDGLAWAEACLAPLSAVCTFATLEGLLVRACYLLACCGPALLVLCVLLVLIRGAETNCIWLLWQQHARKELAMPQAWHAGVSAISPEWLACATAPVLFALAHTLLSCV